MSGDKVAACCLSSERRGRSAARRPRPAAPVSAADGLAVGLEEILGRGLVRRERVLTRARSAGGAAGAPSFFPDLTGWECSDSSFHLEDFVPVGVAVIDDVPVISEAAQRAPLIQGLGFGIRFACLVRDRDQPGPVRCIIGTNGTNATFRFIRPRGRALE